MLNFKNKKKFSNAKVESKSVLNRFLLCSIVVLVSACGSSGGTGNSSSSSSSSSGSSGSSSSSSSSNTSSSSTSSSSSSSSSGGGESELVIAINAGGTAASLDGIEYSRDRYYSGGSAGSTSDPIGGVEDDEIYQSERYGNYSYEIPVTDASYSVTLHFAELYQTESGERSFNVLVEGKEVLSAVDLYSLVGHDEAYSYETEPVEVSDGYLSISLEASIDNATLSGFVVNSGNGGEIVKASSDGTVACPYVSPEPLATYPANWTSGELTVFNNNGGWTWYNDERVLVDADAGKLIVGSAASNGSSSVDVVVHDLVTGQNDKKSLGSLSYADDHNNPGIVITAPGEYFAAYAHHNKECNSYWSNYANGSWSDTVTFSWRNLGCAWGSTNVTYNNPWKLSEEGKIYNFVRSVDSSPNFLLSEDNGKTWEFGGRLTASPQVGYNAGYYKFWGNGTNRIEFFATESHPRDSNTSLFHGYIQDGKSYDSSGKLVDDNVFDTNAPQITSFTQVFRAGGSIKGVTLQRLWNFDVVRYEDGTLAVLWQGRENQCSNKNNCNPGHHLAYSRFDGDSWTSTRLVKGGRTLYRDQSDWWEEDYLGGGALDPNDPRVIYVSTPIDPRDDSTDLGNHEIWKGVTCNNGETFTWTPMTMNSEHENLRPAVPAWDTKNTALLWFRGRYQTAQTYNAEVVGILTREE